MFIDCLSVDGGSTDGLYVEQIFGTSPLANRGQITVPLVVLSRLSQMLHSGMAPFPPSPLLCANELPTFAVATESARLQSGIQTVPTSRRHAQITSLKQHLGRRPCSKWDTSR
jgi:hypothetical protein